MSKSSEVLRQLGNFEVYIILENNSKNYANVVAFLRDNKDCVEHISSVLYSWDESDFISLDDLNAQGEYYIPMYFDDVHLNFVITGGIICIQVAFSPLQSVGVLDSIISISSFLQNDLLYVYAGFELELEIEEGQVSLSQDDKSNYPFLIRDAKNMKDRNIDLKSLANTPDDVKKALYHCFFNVCGFESYFIIPELDASL
ncbi:hypothetical protein [Microscilla marina]|uniref:Uncharacterized protein n=1 Tax=Microscilla marina ATCC 23134 TaxID=313606 RepID=A2A0G6_MICM2|nr:hypothetical protein [Microscilla marina]EAY23865.1 hypothetical protein M23134_01279 [Microscilla marina ATCC 23134]